MEEKQFLFTWNTDIDFPYGVQESGRLVVFIMMSETDAISETSEELKMVLNIENNRQIYKIYKI
jgi:hypothetical protein